MTILNDLKSQIMTLKKRKVRQRWSLVVEQPLYSLAMFSKYCSQANQVPHQQNGLTMSFQYLCLPLS